MDFKNSYAMLPESFYQRIAPVPVTSPELIKYNEELAADLGSSFPLERDALAAIFSGNQLMNGMDPLAMAYAGHQFGGFVPQLGDGRAVLLGEVVTPAGKRYDLQLKGSGPTRFSRNGDGRSALGPVIREYIVSEAMTALGIPSSRALAIVGTGEHVVREGRVPGGVLTRIATGLVRVGTFEYFAARQQWDDVKTLADYVIERHYPEASSEPNPYFALFREVCRATGRLVAQWMAVGFIHGVMNTDNTSICGETLDYGPCAFMDVYAPDTVFSSIDMQGRYAYNNQPQIARWNMSALGGCLLPLLHTDTDAAQEMGQEALEMFTSEFKSTYQNVMCAKIGLNGSEQHFELVRHLLRMMQQDQVDFTIAFRSLAESEEAVASLFSSQDIRGWLATWQREVDDVSSAQRRMRLVNPAYIPRNHRVEQAIRQAEDEGEFALTHQLIDVLRNPYADQPEKWQYRDSPLPSEVVRQTFCGT